MKPKSYTPHLLPPYPVWQAGGALKVDAKDSVGGNHEESNNRESSRARASKKRIAAEATKA
ncbi:MAG TPA: hypothetical protein VES69_03110 [Pyrinomonadaceae bacterium]|nr:hypothetical protein [Pyrinomonadaceae bacterium]